MKSTKSFALLLMLVVVSVIAACGSNNKDKSSSNVASSSSSSSSATQASGEKQKLTVYAYDDTNTLSDPAKVETLFADFKAENNAELQFVTTKSADFLQKLTVSATAGDPIDVIMTNGQYVRSLYSRGMLAELSGAISDPTSRFNQSALDAYTYSDKLYALPWNAATTSAVFYNKAIFEQYGLSVPKTYEELVEVTSKLKENGIHGIAFGGASKFMYPMWYFETLAQTSDNNSLQLTYETLQGNAKFTDPAYVAAMEALAQFGKDGIFQPGVNGADSDAGKALFASGKAAMFYGGTWELGNFEQQLGDKLGVTLFPIIKSGVKAEMTGSGGDGIGLYAEVAPERRDLAIKFIEYMTSDKVNALYNSVDSGVALPSNKNSAVKDDPLVKQLQAEHLPVTTTFLDWFWPQEVVQEFQFQIQAVVGQASSAQEAMEKIQDVFDGLVKNGYDFNGTK